MNYTTETREYISVTGTTYRRLRTAAKKHGFRSIRAFTEDRLKRSLDRIERERDRGLH